MKIDYNVENMIYKVLNHTKPYTDLFCQEIGCKFAHKVISIEYDDAKGKASIIVGLYLVKDKYTLDSTFQYDLFIKNISNNIVVEIVAMYLAHRFIDVFYNALQDFKGGQ